jgi:hypothetical protein
MNYDRVTLESLKLYALKRRAQFAQKTAHWYQWDDMIKEIDRRITPTDRSEQVFRNYLEDPCEHNAIEALNALCRKEIDGR